MQGGKELLGERHVGGHTQVVGTGGEALHVLHLHPSQLGQLIGLVRQEGADREVVVVGFLLALDHDRVDPAVGVFVVRAGEIGKRSARRRQISGFKGRHGYREHVAMGLTVTISTSPRRGLAAFAHLPLSAGGGPQRWVPAFRGGQSLLSSAMKRLLQPCTSRS